MKGVLKNASYDQQKEICSFIKKYEKDFSPKLSKRVDIEDYSKKLLNKAECYIYEEKENIRGFVAFYANNYDSKVAYLSIILVDHKFRGKGVGNKLIERMEKCCRKKGFEKIKMEMSSGKEGLKKWYLDKGYSTVHNYMRGEHECTVMSKEIK